MSEIRRHIQATSAGCDAFACSVWRATTLGIAKVNGKLMHTLPRPAKSREHPTMKPVELIRGMLWNSSRPGDIVLDPFVGSGSTIIAAEWLRRRCFALELDLCYQKMSSARMSRDETLVAGWQQLMRPSRRGVAKFHPPSTDGASPCLVGAPVRAIVGRGSR